VDFAIDERGRLESSKMLRWGNTGDGTFRLAEFGALVEDEGTFDGYTVPTRVRAGWYFGTPRFEADGEFFRGTIDQATFR
jgi:hypothetical protein